MAGGSNFDGEIKNAMSSHEKDPKAKAPSGKRPPPMPASAHNSDAVAKMPPAHGAPQYSPPQPQAQGQQGLTQAVDQFQAHMAPHPAAAPTQPNMMQAHAQIVHALAQKSMM